MKIFFFVNFLIFIGIFYCSLMYGMYRDRAQIAAHQDEKLVLFLQQDFTLANVKHCIARFENKLQVFQGRIKEREESLYESIKVEFNISDEIWEELNNFTKLSKDEEQAVLHLPLEGVVHDEKMPSYIKQMFITMLTQKGINPNRIRLSYNQERSGCHVCCSYPHSCVENSRMSFCGISTPGKIKISKLFGSLSHQEAFCAMLIEIIAQQLDMRNFILGGYIGRAKAQDNKSLKTVYMHFEYIASLYAALSNQKTADLMYKYRLDTASVSLDHTAHDRYFTWHAKIKRYWDCIAWLRQYSNQQQI
jgi:hypothetical protein